MSALVSGAPSSLGLAGLQANDSGCDPFTDPSGCGGTVGGGSGGGSGCNNSPENPTALLAVLGGVGILAGASSRRLLLDRNRRQAVRVQATRFA